MQMSAFANKTCISYEPNRHALSYAVGEDVAIFVLQGTGSEAHTIEFFLKTHGRGAVRLSGYKDHTLDSSSAMFEVFFNGPTMFVEVSDKTQRYYLTVSFTPDGHTGVRCDVCKSEEYHSALKPEPRVISCTMIKCLEGYDVVSYRSFKNEIYFVGYDTREGNYELVVGVVDVTIDKIKTIHYIYSDVAEITPHGIAHDRTTSQVIMYGHEVADDRKVYPHLTVIQVSF